ncbi:MAG: Ppx/GppA family phosphatase [Robiginitomaculum sp.]|nr:Ppx/GppA family phosphatase [Robiginitomaculum sp.]
MISEPAIDKAFKRRVGVIDIGSNSVRFVVYAIHGAAFASVYDEKVLAGLGRDLRRTGKLSPQGCVQALAALKRFTALARAQNLDDVLVAATAALRDASDAPEFIALVKTQTGLDIAPLSGVAEASMSAYGVITGEARAKGLAADLGGASLELVKISDEQALDSMSYQLGPFAMYDGRFDPLTLRPLIESKFADTLSQNFSHLDTLYLIGGAWRNLAIIHQKRNDYPLRMAHNYRLDVQVARQLANWACSPQGTQALLNWPNISQRRADTLPYGGLILSVLLEKLPIKHVVIAPGGLRDGLVYTSLSAETKKRNALFDACSNLSRRDGEQGKMGRALFAFLSGVHAGLPRAFNLDNENRIRKAASLLIGTGAGLHPDHRAQIVYEIALYGPLPGLTHKERAYLALMLFRSFRSRKKPPNNAAIQYLLSDEEQMSAKIYGEALRAAVVLSGRSSAVLKNFSLGVEPGVLSLCVEEGADVFLIERGQTHFDTLANLIGCKLNVHRL